MTGEQSERERGQSMVLCCRKKRGCPVISEENGEFVLQEDGEGVRFDREQAELLVKYLRDRLSR